MNSYDTGKGAASHENKSCSACPEDQLKPFYFLNFEFNIFILWLWLSLFTNVNGGFFYFLFLIHNLSCELRVHRAGSQLKMSECQTKAGNQISFSHSHSLSFTHSRHTEQLLFSCLCSKVTVYRQKNGKGFLAGNQLYEL